MLRRSRAAAFAVAALSIALSAAASAAPKQFDHVYTIVMENQNFDNLVGRNRVDPVTQNILEPDTPYITSLAQTAGLSTLFFGVTHPSLPNYLTMIAGDYFNVQDDNDSCFALPAPGPGCHAIDRPNLIDRLEAKHLTWTALEETMPVAGFLGSQYPGAHPRLYAQKHNPFVYFNDVAKNPKRLALIKPLTQSSLSATLANPPNFTHIVPNQCNDMHGTSPTCTKLDDLLKTGDRTLKGIVTQIVASPGYTRNSAIFIIWDEDDYSSKFGCCSSLPQLGGGHTLALVLSATSANKRSAQPMNHYSYLRTILEGFNLAPLGHSNDAGVIPMWDLF